MEIERFYTHHQWAQHKKEKIIYYLLFSFTRSSQQLDRCITFMTFSVHEKAIFVDSMKLGVFDRIHCKICSIIAFSFWTGYFRQYMKYHWLNGLWFSKSFDRWQNLCHIIWNYTSRCFYNDLFIGRKKYVSHMFILEENISSSLCLWNFEILSCR